MRIATLILGLVLSVGLFMQSLLIFGLSGAIEDEASGAAGALGLFAAFLWLVAAALVISVPRVSLALYIVAALACFGGASNFPDLTFWGIVSLVLAAFAFLGWRGKRKADAEKRLLLDAAKSQRVMAEVVIGKAVPVTPMNVSQPRPLGSNSCPSCGRSNESDSRFCRECGVSLLSGASVS